MKVVFSIEATEEIYKQYISVPLKDRESWVQGRVDEEKSLFETVDACVAWDSDRKEAREVEIEAIQEQRYDDIATRLLESGWHPAVVESSIFRGSGYVKGTHLQPITDAGDQITVQYYLLDEYLEDFSKQLPLGLVMPHTNVIALSEPI
ncbi:hypothetical protein PQX77_021961 [Marasmius sp. AFHP31]|nr:hypothetical protein PQX77_021961 [Marasmius sp. AFHP31]